ncbi:MAG TPA: hypothetical protein VGF25_21915 [Thermoleophilaceae bacterium]
MRPEAIKPLEALVGEWEFAASVQGRESARGRTRFEWMEDGTFVLQRADAEPLDEFWAKHSPFPTTSVIGADDGDGRFSMLYSDARGVVRIYEMTLEDGVWNVWREAPGFRQRFVGTFSDDGLTISAHWDRSSDGSDWARDFDMTYTRV